MELDYFIEREQQLLGERFNEYYESFDQTANRGITINTSRMNAEQFKVYCRIPAESSPFCENALRLTSDIQGLGNHPYHKAGVFYIQEPSAASAATLLHVEPGEIVLDMCAAPGGKSSQIGASLQGKGLLVSNEYNESRAAILRSNIERMGFSNVLVLNEKHEHLAKIYPSFFDKILVDAPCSGEGMFRKEPMAQKQHNRGLVLQCAAVAADILESAAVCLKPGGTLVFSTCTFAPEEDEGQIGHFLSLHPEFELMDCNVTFGSVGEENRLCGFSADASKMRRIWPYQGGEGHFMACLKKTDNTMSVQSGHTKKKSRDKSSRKNNLSPWTDFANKYFPVLVNQAVFQMNDWVVLPACEVPEKLHVLSNGVMAGEIRGNRFVPGHQLCMAYGSECTNKEKLMLDDDRTYAYLRGEEIEAKTASAGWCAVLVDGFPLGWGKASDGKIKNHLPKALRNLK